MKNLTNNSLYKLYETIQDNIKEVGTTITTLAEKDRLEDKNILKSIKGITDKTQKEFDDLKENSEWNKFTIAFYGETNAGKSTLIEALRLYLKESTKQDAQQKFLQIQQERGITQEAFDAIRADIISLDKETVELDQRIKTITKTYDSDIHNKTSQIDDIKKTIEQIKKAQSFWQKILHFFKKLPEENLLNECQEELKKLVHDKNDDITRTTNLLHEAMEQKRQKEEQNQRMEADAITLLEPYRDGKIIGDGRSDYTRESTSFDFEVGNQAFSLIDVPGIEGDEDIVKDAINKSIKKAHAVFYVIRNPRPPQTNADSSSKKGTLEKIKSHLASQTEVWTIYNHPVTNYRSLNQPLISQEEKAGLNALDDIMQTHLSTQYQGHIVVSAQPAFLALSQCIIPGSLNAQSKKNFMRHLSADEMLERSALPQFVEQLQNTIVNDYKGKIFRSNQKKALDVLNQNIQVLAEILTSQKEAQKSINLALKNTKSQIETALYMGRNKFIVSQSEELDRLKSKIREDMRAKIEHDISKEEFESALEYCVKFSAEELSKNLHCRFEKNITEISEQIQQILTKNSQYIREILESKQKVLSNTLSIHNISLPKVDIDNGLQTTALIASITGIAMAIATAFAPTTAGLSYAVAATVIGIITGIWGSIKAIRSFFSKDYKKKQQYNALEKTLPKIVEQLEPRIKETITNIKNELEEKVQPIFQQFKDFSDDYAHSIQIVQKAHFELSHLSDELEKSHKQP